MAAPKTEDIFCELPCLSESSAILSGIALRKKWFKGSDTRYLAAALQQFIAYNHELLDFLNIVPSIISSGSDVGLTFRTGQYVGSIPLRAPDTGKQIGDFVVLPRYLPRDYFESYLQILNLLEHSIEAEFIDSIPLISGRNFRAPLYFEALHYITELTSFTKRTWRKFKSVREILAHPSANVDWNSYIKHEYDPRRRLEFPARRNILNEDHLEYQQLKYVYELALTIIMQPATPSRIKAIASAPISYLDSRLYNCLSSSTKEIAIRLSDPPAVKLVKEAANRILQKNTSFNKAWRVDFSLVFERFIQYIFHQVAKEIGAVLSTNVRFQARGQHLPKWTLRHLEADAVLRKGEHLFFIDAKYKAHLFNRNSDGKHLKDEFRHDLHQILAYSSFDTGAVKNVFLVYPSSSPSFQIMDYSYSHNRSISKVAIVGAPLDISTIDAVKRLIIDAIY